MSENLSFTLELEQIQSFEFRVKFDWPDVPDLKLDEPPPLGHAAGPNAARLIAAGVANCLSSSLLFCLGKFKQAPGPLRATVTGTIARNERGRMRIAGLDVTLRLSGSGDSVKYLDRCLAQFEDYCIVTESVRQGIPVGVHVLDGTGTELFAHGAGAPAGVTADAIA